MKHTLLSFAILLTLNMAAASESRAAEPIEIGSRLELFIDDHLIDRFDGDVSLQLHKPQPQEVVLVTDKPWEGNTSAYYTIFRDGDLFRMYYRGSHFDEESGKATHPEVTCYAESRDGVNWTKPELGLFKFDGSKANNIVWDGIGTHCFTPFKDGHPDCPPDARYKAISRGRPQAEKGLYAFKSADGIHWEIIQREPVITDGAFDSQNLAFWDNHRREYRDYHRNFVDGVRAIMTATSPDFVTWTDPVNLEYPDTPNEHLYTNAVQPYFRAPHLFVGFPTRFLPDEGQRVEPTFMSSRDGQTFHRFTEPVIPEDAPADRAGNRSNYMTWGLVQLPGDEKHLSVYATEAYYTGPNSRLRRFTYRVDGFVSAHGSAQGGELVTKPLEFAGEQLAVNFATGEGGSIRIELQDAEGKPIEGFGLADAKPLHGDSLKQPVTWKSSGDLTSLSGKPVRLRMELKNADVYSMQFGAAQGN